MASLSNINGLFDVHSTGAILFSTSHGTSGQILKSNGNAAPTWVAASTVIGGPYLPLTGGTLSGATATATGISFTVGGTAVFNGDMTLPAAADHFLIGAGSLSTTGRIKFGLPSWSNSIGLESYWMVMRSNSNEGYKFIDSGGNTYAQFNASTNSAGAYKTTFLGNLKLIAGTSTTYFSEKGYLGDSFNFGTGETTDGVSYTINGAQAGTAGNYFRWLTQTGAATPTEKVRITDYGSLVVGNTPGTNVNWGKIQCGGTITVGNSSGTYLTHGRISGDSDGMKLKGTSTGTYSDPMGVTIDGYNVGINTNSPNVGNAFGLVIRSWATLSRLVFWNSTSGEVSSRGQRISFQDANCIFENMESGYYAFKTGGSGANPSERMRIDSSGNVNVDSGRIRIAGGGSDSGTQLNLWSDTNGYCFIAGYQTIFNQGGNNSRSEVMRITSTGLGIGTTNPSSELEVAGRAIVEKLEVARYSDSNAPAAVYVGRSANPIGQGGIFRLGAIQSSSTVNKIDEPFLITYSSGHWGCQPMFFAEFTITYYRGSYIKYWAQHEVSQSRLEIMDGPYGGQIITGGAPASRTITQLCASCHGGQPVYKCVWKWSNSGPYIKTSPVVSLVEGHGSARVYTSGSSSESAIDTYLGSAGSPGPAYLLMGINNAQAAGFTGLQTLN